MATQEYVRLTFKKVGGGRRKVWAWVVTRRPTIIVYRRITAEAERTNEILLCAPSDVIDEQPARMNLHYGELELTNHTSKLLTIHECRTCGGGIDCYDCQCPNFKQRCFGCSH